MNTLAGTGTMIRFVARRERVRVPVYLLVLVGLIASTAAQSEELYSTQAERDEYAATVAGNPGLIAMVGPAYRVTTVGGDTAWQWGAFGAVTAALMSMFIVGRHTRAEEQSGRSELVRASVLGRFAPTAATMIVLVAVNVLVAATVALAMIGLDQPAAGSIALGASLGSAGLLFAAVAVLAMQVNQSTGGAYGLVGAVLGASYMLRAAGDVGDGTLSWLSPIGWVQSMRPFADERWWPLVLLLAVAVVLVAAAFALLSRRDDGAGLVASRPGRAKASGVLAHPLGLALRLSRGALIGWAIGLFLGGVSIGLTGQDVESILGDSDEVDELFARAGGSLVDNYLAVSLSSMALIGTGFAIQAVLRMRSEETSGRLEPLLAAALARPRWAAGHLAMAAGGTVLILAASGFGAGIADAISSDDAGRLPLLLGSSVALAPAVWVLIGIAIALFGLVPRAASASWGFLAACFLLLYLGPLLSLPDWVMNLSPYTHVPLLPAADLTIAPLIVLTAIAAALTAAGVLGLRRRDIAST
ncbi:MAG TPA: ABC transporter permease [Solirubrobacteraceae bacterium]|nr:ABC transporter permease [Solirubrobacteraceae bacterium]